MTENPYPASDRAKEIVKKSMTMDTLLSIAGVAGQQIRDEQYHPYMDDCMATGFKAIALCPSADSGMHTFMDSLKAWEWHLHKLNERPDKYKIVRTAKDIHQAVAEGKLTGAPPWLMICGSGVALAVYDLLYLDVALGSASSVGTT